jgi:hypothetical protein
MKARLNLFQATILRWRDLHPYNAVHIVRLDGRVDRARLHAAIQHHLESLGLTGLDLDRAAGRYEWTGGASTANFDVTVGADDASEALRREIERQLNLAYPESGRIEPFRFFVIDAADSFAFGVAYDHFVAGGDSIVTLLGGIVARYDGHASTQKTALVLYPPSYGLIFRRQAAALLAGLSQLPSLAAACKRSFRPQFHDADDGHTGFVHFRLEAHECESLTRAASAWKVTHNDLILGVLLKCLSPFAKARRGERRRQELGVASIVNIRRDFGPNIEPSFGPVLASFRVSHRVPDDIAVRELVAAVNAETLRVKRDKVYLQSLIALAMVGVEWRFLSVSRRRRFFAKHYPLWAGTTPLNVTGLWAAAAHGRDPLQYLRAVPTGPLAPLALAVTTTGENVHVGMTFRTTAFGQTEIDALARDIRHNIACLNS